jgi:hypothetical protein
MYIGGARNSRFRKKLNTPAAMKCGRQARSAWARFSGSSVPAIFMGAF